VTATLLVIGSALLVVLVSVVIGLLTGEARGWLQHLSRRLVTRASDRLPESHRDRGEEWLADLYEKNDRPLTMLLTALRIWRNARASARETPHAAAGKPVRMATPADLGHVQAGAVSATSLGLTVGDATTVKESARITVLPPGS
jgi:hypothetical protein